MSGLKNSERACNILEVIDEIDVCDGIIYKIKNYTTIPTDFLDSYFFEESVCCMNGDQFTEWFISIGEAIGKKSIFEIYAE